MFKNNDKSFFMIRKFVNVVFFVLMCVSVIAGIVIIATSPYMMNDGYYNYTVINYGKVAIGVAVMLLGPVVIQFFWLVADCAFNRALDVKIIRNVVCGTAIPEMPAPLFYGKKKKAVNAEVKAIDVYEQLKAYKELLKEGVLSEQEFEQIKNGLLDKNVAKNESFESGIDKIKKLKTYLDDEVLTKEEFVAEKAKILKK